MLFDRDVKSSPNADAQRECPHCLSRVEQICGALARNQNGFLTSGQISRRTPSNFAEKQAADTSLRDRPNTKLRRLRKIPD